MIRLNYLLIPLFTVILCLCSCSGGNGDPTVPSGDNPEMRIALTRTNPNHPPVDSVQITVTRLDGGTVEMPGRNIQIASDTGSMGLVTDRGDGIYEAIWTGVPGEEVTITAYDLDSDPILSTSITFIAATYLVPEWDVPIRLASPMSTNGWEAAPFLTPDGDHIVFSYITLDIVALAADVVRSIGQERPGQSIPQTMDLYIAERPDTPSWWADWDVEHCQANLFQSIPMHMSAPCVASDGVSAFCTIQEFDGLSYTPTKLYSIDPEFSITPTALGSPPDMSGLGEDNPYFDATNGWLYFDTYDLGNPLSKQNIWAAQSMGGGQFYDPVPLTDLNTVNIETQPFLHEPSSMLYFASDRQKEEFILAIWRSQTLGDFTGAPELVMEADLALGRPSISWDEDWFCISYAKLESSGANADIAMMKRYEY